MTFEWSWWADGGWRRELVHDRADHLTAQSRGVPIPVALKNEEQILLGNLEEAAAKGFTPCEYLGMEMGSGFEKDPANWPRRDSRRSQALVTYEWKGVCRGDAKDTHRVQVRADHARLREALPQDPLTKSAPKNLFFTVEFMQAFADRKWPGTTYTGISCGSDRPSSFYRCRKAVSIYRTHQSIGHFLAARWYACLCSSSRLRRTTN